MPPEIHPSALVLLIGEICDDPRVFKTCLSLKRMGAEVTVACTDPTGRPREELVEGFRVLRFPHRREFFLKKLYTALQGFLRPGMSSALASLHEDITANPLRTAIRNAALSLNFRHFLHENDTINRSMLHTFTQRINPGAFLPAPAFDLVHCNDVDTLPAGIGLKCAGATRRVLYDAHEFWPGIGIQGSPPNAVLRSIEASYIHEADYVVTVNSLIADMMKREYALPTSPSVVMNCPLRYDSPAAPNRINIPVRVIYQGKVQAFRGLEELVLAFRRIDGAELVISGYGPIEQRLIRLAASEGIAERVHFTGRYSPSDALSIVAGCDIGVLPFDAVTKSIEYSSPNKLFDYAMGGLAVAATSLPFIRQFIEENDAGRTFSRNDPDEIAATINEMAADTERLTEYRHNARTAAYDRFHWDKQFSENYPWMPETDSLP